MKQHYLYRLWLAGNIQYIGRATNVKQRLAQHKSDKLFDYADYILVDKCDMDKIEMYFINKELPPLNKGINKFMAEKGAGIFKYKYSKCEFIPLMLVTGLLRYACAKTNKLDLESSPICLSSSFLMASSVLNVKNNVLFELNLVDKVVYSYINEMVISSGVYEYSVNDVQDISNSINIERETVAITIKKLEDIGMLIITTEETEAGRKTNYFSDSLFCGRFKLFTKRDIPAGGSEDVEITMNQSRGIWRDGFSA